MGALERLHDLLSITQRHPGAPAEPDYVRHREYLYGRFESIRDATIDANYIEGLFEWWNERIDDFAHEVHWGLIAQWGAEPSDVRGREINEAVKLRLILEWKTETAGMAEPGTLQWLDRLRELSLKSIAERARSAVDGSDWLRWRQLGRYAAEIQLIVLDDSGGIRLAAPGEFFLKLKGRDAVRWLLVLESLQSYGPADPWRLSRDAAEHLLRKPSGSIEQVYETSLCWDHSLWVPDMDGGRPSAERMAAFQLLEFTYTGPLETERLIAYELTERGHEVLREVTSETDTPLRLMARALLEDQVSGLGLSHLSAGPGESSSATIRHARMVAHEVRNALVPVKVALGRVWKHMDAVEPGTALASQREVIEAGIDHIFGFVQETVELSRHVPSAMEPFLVRPAVRDAIAALDEQPLERVSLQVEAGGEEAAVQGDRQRFVMTLVNILRNADQAAGRAARIAVSIRVQAGRVTIVIDDDGPGVPSERRQDIFANGVSHRDGGTGHGLSLARDVIEQEMSGTIRCEDSPGGGARFVIDLPADQGGTR